MITRTSQTSPPYAISEVAVYVEYYDNSNSNSLRLKMYFVLSRSECGVKRTTDATLPSKRPVFPATLPGGNGLTPYSGTGFTVASAPAPVKRMALQDNPETTATTSLPPTITLTSPLESATAAVTTTSAPPDPSASDPTESSGTITATSTNRESTATTNDTTTVLTASTTSAPPTIVIPTDPGTLSPTAQTEKVGTVEVDGTATDVVVKGSAAPADSRTSEQALDTWINEGTRLAGDWKTFTSTDPDSDGWRWAAINQETGTVVYVR
ncbi:hypothetical protein [Dietzia psychralcaliphila]|uniref:hypothetical protein n=1 Tax=Dietzia psychralcaliphila TaxID=139021 RepID=UPI0011B209E1|nr:hypothetical protein [Dietzia psychralcaliphila]